MPGHKDVYNVTPVKAGSINTVLQAGNGVNGFPLEPVPVEAGASIRITIDDKSLIPDKTDSYKKVKADGPEATHLRPSPLWKN
jgi:hypothetical protein